MNYWIILFSGILFEMLGIMSLKANEHFTRFWPSVSTVACYSIAIYLSVSRPHPLPHRHGLRRVVRDRDDHHPVGGGDLVPGENFDSPTIGSAIACSCRRACLELARRSVIRNWSLQDGSDCLRYWDQRLRRATLHHRTDLFGAVGRILTFANGIIRPAVLHYTTTTFEQVAQESNPAERAQESNPAVAGFGIQPMYPASATYVQRTLTAG
jgi:hypothetical protein